MVRHTKHVTPWRVPFLILCKQNGRDEHKLQVCTNITNTIIKYNRYNEHMPDAVLN